MTDFNLDLSAYVKKPSEVTHPELAILYGRPGCGKTWLAASASELPHVKKTLIIDTEGSTAGTLAEFSDDKVDILPVRTFGEFDKVVGKLLDPETIHGYDVIIIDTFDVAQGWAIKHFENTAPLSAKTGEKDGFAVWGNVKEWSEKVARGMKAIDAFGILVFHEREEKDKSGSLITKLMLSGSAKDTLPGIPDMVVYLERNLIEDKETTIAHFATEDNKVTKNRFRFPPRVGDPTFPALFKFIDDARAKANDKKEKN